MPHTCAPTGRGPKGVSARSTWASTQDPNEIPEGWIDQMTKRLLDELNRQLIRMENVKNDDFSKTSATERERDARTLAQLERTLERLSRSAADSKSRKTITGAIDADIHIKLQRKLVPELAGRGASGISGKPGK